MAFLTVVYQDVGCANGVVDQRPENTIGINHISDT